LTSNGNKLSRFEDLGRPIAGELDVDEAVLDGEVIASDETAASCFSIYSGGRGNLPPRHM
jgi:ATP-dependent DNA ligase